MSNSLIAAVLGPTASGKSKIALQIAKEFNGVIINCDSRQLYQEMFIGTASPTEGDKKIVPHKLFNFVQLDSDFSGADYAANAKIAIEKAQKENKLPVLCGGTGFYYDLLAEGQGVAGKDELLNQKLQEIYAEKGLNHIVEMLGEKDPEALSIVDLQNPRRVLRALEIVITTGKPFSHNVQNKIKFFPDADFCPFVLKMDRQLLRERIKIRIDQMFEMGLKTEAESLFKKYPDSKTFASTIGYQEFIPHFKGDCDLDEVKQRIGFSTGQYAKRQETWFKKRPSDAITFNAEDKEIFSKISSILSKKLK
ncbi:MAG: tRNA (adenosine(37)-N6)-dimethylallyltransferase MiaA [Candidatus Riflebacteria bacterium]|nr:tRNA (adenosine(37)-N6)-dimethylallyltransferase MiaA [Candidatus Riflebacteria bacterium]